ncbi:MAG: tetratricopeptide repeat protein, partial [Planctomycetota bacterium]
MQRFLAAVAVVALSAAALAAEGTGEAVEAIRKGDYAKALKILVPLAQKGDAQAQYNLGQMYFSGWGVAKDWNKAEAWLRRSSDQGHEWARVLLAFTVDGLGKHEEAVRLYQWAAQKGVAGAQTRLAMMYRRGLGVERDLREAFRLFHLAAKQGDAAAQAELAQAYAMGAGLPKDLSKAATL